jgi:hypothetical protein
MFGGEAKRFEGKSLSALEQEALELTQKPISRRVVEEINHFLEENDTKGLDRKILGDLFTHLESWRGDPVPPSVDHLGPDQRIRRIIEERDLHIADVMEGRVPRSDNGDE